MWWDIVQAVLFIIWVEFYVWADLQLSEHASRDHGKKNEIFKEDGSAWMKPRLGKVRLGQVKLRCLPEDSLDIETGMVSQGSTDSKSLSYR